MSGLFNPPLSLSPGPIIRSSLIHFPLSRQPGQWLAVSSPADLATTAASFSARRATLLASPPVSGQISRTQQRRPSRRPRHTREWRTPHGGSVLPGQLRHDSTLSRVEAAHSGDELPHQPRGPPSCVCAVSLRALTASHVPSSVCPLQEKRNKERP
jgi:hypothetical protein